jgi:two-component system, LuxR family, response regulator FixJ
MMIQRNVYVVDDDMKILDLMQSVLTLEQFSVSCFESAEAFLEKTPSDAQGCLLMDLVMPGMGGIELQAHVQAHYPGLAIVVVSGAADVSTAVKVMHNGAITLLEKPFQVHQLTLAIQQALNRSEQRSQRLAVSADLGRRLSKLSQEEQHVMKYMVRGVSNKQAAKELDIGARTLDRRRAAVLDKMHVDSVAELASALTTFQYV